MEEGRTMTTSADACSGDSRDPGILTVLGAGPGLGFLVPGAVVAVRAGSSRPVDFDAIERLLPAARRDIARRTRSAFHRDFRLALLGQRAVRPMIDELDADLVEQLLEGWAREGRRHFVVLSGFWAELVERHLARTRVAAPRVHFLHVDSAPSSSWGLVRERSPAVNDVWFLHYDTGTLNYRLAVSDDSPVPWSGRESRLLAHGGGWGMGTYRERIAAIDRSRWPIDVLCYEPADVDVSRTGTRHFLLDPAWCPWESRLDEPFPPLGEIDASYLPGVPPVFARNRHFPELCRLTRHAAAVISKPGGGTLIDCLDAATPLLLIEPFGDYERKNGELWKRFGFALDLADWVADGSRREALEPLHRNLLAARASTPEYAALWRGGE